MTNKVESRYRLVYKAAMASKIFYRAYIKDELERRIGKNPRYSLRSFAKSLGFEATVISQIIAGKRTPSEKTARRLIQALALDPKNSQSFLNSLAKEQQSRDLSRKSSYFANFKVRAAQVPELNVNTFKIIADWYHYAILALSLTKNFKSNCKWIAGQLGLNESETKFAVERLLELGFLKDRGGIWTANNEGFTTADKHLTTAALRSHQKQILGKAVESLENDPIEDRSMSSVTAAIDPGRLPEAKRRIQLFTDDLISFLEGGESTRVFEIAIALFPLQKKDQR